MGEAVDDEAVVARPSVRIVYVIMDIAYPSDDGRG